jgi:hypothetical protein
LKIPHIHLSRNSAGFHTRLNYPDVQTASGHLSWSHYCELLSVSDTDARSFYGMVFYNKILKAYVLIDLKIGSLKFENVGQMNGYVNYYEIEMFRSVRSSPSFSRNGCSTFISLR